MAGLPQAAPAKTGAAKAAAALQVDIARLAHSMVALAPAGFSRDAMLSAALILDNRRNPLRLTCSP